MYDDAESPPKKPKKKKGVFVDFLSDADDGR